MAIPLLISILGSMVGGSLADLISDKDRRQVFATFTTAHNIGAVLGPALGAFFFLSIPK
ncbi:hypothetical protein [Paenibacillus sp. KS1]|uniref:hypothetical protein n=1 Tax=Paenibacillus sp. KS1 TaxID=1849249 RepID=UPI000ABF68F1|nr:hypothetical protein [Paenibacillus sp. KS1]